MTAIVLLGPPGAGKGTVSEVLEEQGFTHISTGELLREEIRRETPLGLEARSLIDQGKFVPDEVVVGIIRDLLNKADAEEKFLFDGFPRTLVQAQKLDDIISTLSGELSEVILLECPDDVIVERLSGRRTCNKCGSVYHVVYNPASNVETCDVDGCQLKIRPDDLPETIQKRLDIYAEQTAPLVSYYQAEGIVLAVDASKSIPEVRSAVLERMG